MHKAKKPPPRSFAIGWEWPDGRLALWAAPTENALQQSCFDGRERNLGYGKPVRVEIVRRQRKKP